MIKGTLLSHGDVQIDGRPVARGQSLLQYCIDRDEHPVLTADGRPVHFEVDDAGKVVTDVAGSPRLVPVDVPPGSTVEPKQS